jgi:hypothetical protein
LRTQHAALLSYQIAGSNARAQFVCLAVASCVWVASTMQDGAVAITVTADDAVAPGLLECTIGDGNNPLFDLNVTGFDPVDMDIENHEPDQPKGCSKSVSPRRLSLSPRANSSSGACAPKSKRPRKALEPENRRFHVYSLRRKITTWA